MHPPVKYFEKVLTVAANGAWHVFERLNRIRPNASFTPSWSDKPLLKSWQKTKPTLGWPRTTDSLCPKCIPEARTKILKGEGDVSSLVNEKVGEIKAQVIERDGEIWMVKDCPIHGRFEDVMAIDVQFFKHLEDVFPGRDIRAHNDEKLHHHGSSTIKHGRGSVLTVDLTNRCNMMCDPCFMDANQVGFVHELTWDDIKTLLDNAITIKPKRQMSVQFSGGEPTLSPYFLDAVRYARKVGYISTQAATNGIEFAKSPEFARESAAAGLRYAYLQFDGIGNAAHSHRHVGNLFDVKIQAIENLYDNGVDIVPVTTLINGVNNEQVGSLIRFALDNPKKIPFLSFQPVSFTGRDEAVTPERRFAQRYTLSHLAHDVKKINDAARGHFLSSLGMGLAVMRNYNPFKAPTHFTLKAMLEKFDKTYGVTGRNYGKVTPDRTFEDIELRRKDRWNFLFIAGMWFQDLFNYDFRRTEQCIIPYATQEGEISFCAYNTGVGWRNIIEKMHQTATLNKWYEERGRHLIYAGNKDVDLPTIDHSLQLRADDVNKGIQTDLDAKGIAKTARDEVRMARDKKQVVRTPEDEAMEKLYRERVMNEKPAAENQAAKPAVVQIEV